MMWALLMNRFSLAALAAFFVGGLGFYAGDHHGWFHHKYMQVIADLELKNKELDKLNAADAVIVAKEAIESERLKAAFDRTDLKKCLIDKEQAEALNALRGG